MLMLLSCKSYCLSYMTFLAAISDTVVQYLGEVSVYLYGNFLHMMIKQYSTVTYLGCILDENLSGESMATRICTENRTTWMAPFEGCF